MQIISPIKQRILQYIDTIGISKRDFYAKSGISRGTLESNTGITEETMAKFIVFCPDISPAWLLLGEGNATLKKIIVSVEKILEDPLPNYGSPPLCEKCKMKDELIESLRQQIRGNNQQIAVLNKFIKKYEDQDRPQVDGQKRKAV